jgi:hypothetical protein
LLLGDDRSQELLLLALRDAEVVERIGDLTSDLVNSSEVR